MDKNTFAAYEYVPSNSSGADTVIFVIQEDGTFRLDRQVQYVAQVQDENESMDGTQACAVYDVDPQQFYVDVPNHPGELISVPDNYVPPATSSEEASKLYANSFLLQTVGSETDASVQGDKDMTISVQFKESDEMEELDVGFNVVNNNCTEITLSDEQYTCLEEKGWVLIENNGKIYILDAYGLHDVTTKNELIQNVNDKNKIELPIEEESTGLLKDSPTYPIDNVDSKNMPLEQETVETQMCEQKEIEKEELHENKLEINEWEKIGKPLTFGQTSDIYSTEQLKEPPHPELQKQQTSKIKILTKYNFKDIPDKIVLGRTSNGKKLVAKVVKRTASNQNLENNHKLKPEDSKVNESDETHEDTIRLINKDASKALPIDETEYETLVQRAMKGEIECSPDEVLDASNVISQLFQVPEFSSSVAGRNIVVTKVYKNKFFGESRRTTSFVSGCVKSEENGHGLLFKHVPDLLKKLTYNYDEYIQKQSTRSVLKPNAKRMPDCKILQVHISESRHNGVYAISFVLKERFLPCMQQLPGLRRSSRLHACSACAAIFRSATQLSEHQAEQNHAMDSEDTLTIDTDKIPVDVQTYTIMESRYYVVNTSKGTEYCCFQCSKRFDKLVNCTRHMKIVHTTPLPLKPVNEDELFDDPSETPGNGNAEFQPAQNLVDANDDQLNTAYQCKMCPRTYHHPASLSKHINKIHIQPSAHRRANRAVT